MAQLCVQTWTCTWLWRQVRRTFGVNHQDHQEESGSALVSLATFLLVAAAKNCIYVYCHRVQANLATSHNSFYNNTINRIWFIY